MSKVSPQKKDHLIRAIEKKYGVDLMKYKTDAELHRSLRHRGLPSLSKLLKMVESA